MAIFNKGGRYAQSNHKSNKSHSKFLIIVCVVFAIALATIIVLTTMNKSGETRETRFIEQETEYIKKGETISINDPSLGAIEIEAVEGFAKNTYEDENFIMDDNGMMTYYVDDKVASCMGIDLSEYQGEVDFEKVKAQGFEFVILRIGGRYYSQEGDLYTDSGFKEYYKQAKAAGLHVGGYFFSQATNASEAQQEAEYVLSEIKGMDFDYPIAFDWEIIQGDTARTDSVTGEDLTQCAIAFCDTINEAGLESIIYSSTSLIYYQYDLEQLKDYEFWIADYEDKPSMYYHFTMWQYNIEGKVDGVGGNVDMNICMKNY